MKSVWTWSGRHFGYWVDDDLWSHQGKHVGRRRGSEIYGPTGFYIGELMNNGRLLSSKSKGGLRAPAFVASQPRPPEILLPDSEAHAAYWGHVDFPHPDAL